MDSNLLMFAQKVFVDDPYPRRMIKCRRPVRVKAGMQESTCIPFDHYGGYILTVAEAEKLRLFGRSVGEDGWIIRLTKDSFWPSYLDNIIANECKQMSDVQNLPILPKLSIEQHLTYAGISDCFNVLNLAFHKTTINILNNNADRTEEDEAVIKYHQDQLIKYKEPMQKHKLMELFQSVLNTPNTYKYNNEQTRLDRDVFSNIVAKPRADIQCMEVAFLKDVSINS